MVCSMGPKIVVIGTITRDVIHIGSEKKMALGGAPYFASEVFKEIGMQHGIVSMATKSLIRQLYKSKRIAKEGVQECKNMPVIDIYEIGTDTRSRYMNMPAKLGLSDIPRGFFDADAIIVSTLTNEVSLQLLREIRKKFKGLIALDIQGYTRNDRKLRSGRYVTEKEKRMPRYWKALLEISDVVKLNQHEAKAIGGKRGMEKQATNPFQDRKKILLITMGKDGSSVLYGGKVKRVKPVNVKSLKHAVGAGDKLLALFTAGLVLGNDPADALVYANRKIAMFLN